ncbi:Golgi apparatus membrane protein tvp18 [Penicillium malachiteum]|uniref:Golgi apparatus membrane protein tvp18 n=1 Tax=Penicillium malachiteum TaxID=1324776 RepID=UPI002547353F|nr:Golgi apparatus membrane protein tvp18 [Penicillium malachiteum]KAJ5721751.1 Golgi apparatus membrane protein tvp18 [Penicillium malachiteum]
MTLADEFRSRNFSIYGQWTGVLGIILCLALGIANIFTFHVVRIIFAVLAIASALVILFIEVPWLLRICPTSGAFDGFIRRFTTNWMRAAMYTALSAIQWASLCTGASSLIAAAVVLIIAALFYALAGLKKQDFVSSKTLGGQSVVQMIV